MINSPLKSYGFVYTYNGIECALDVTALSEEEARGRVAAMSNASFVGELFEDTSFELSTPPAGRTPAEPDRT